MGRPSIVQSQCEDPHPHYENPFPERRRDYQNARPGECEWLGVPPVMC